MQTLWKNLMNNTFCPEMKACEAFQPRSPVLNLLQIETTFKYHILFLPFFKATSMMSKIGAFMIDFVLHVRKFMPVLVTGLLLIGLNLGLYISQPLPLTQASLNIYDLFLARRAAGVDNPVPVIVDLDEKSLREQGQWPWPRYRLALLLEKLSQAGAAVVALDILISEPDRTSPTAIMRSLREELGVDVDFAGLPEHFKDNDALLAKVVAANPVVLGGFVRFDNAPDQTTTIPGVRIIERIDPNGVPAAQWLMEGTGMTPLVPALEQAGPVAFFNMLPDQDGLIRRVPLVVRVGNTYYANLSLQALMRGMNVKTLRLNSGPAGLYSVNVGKLSIPITPAGFMLVPFAGPEHTFPYISASDVFKKDFDPERVRGRIVFVGTSAVGLQDIRSTPLDRYMPGVEVHASVVNAALTNQHITLLPFEGAVQAAIIVLGGGMGLIFFGLLPPIVAMLGNVTLAGVLFIFSGWWFTTQGVFLTPLWGMLALLTQGTGLTVQRLWSTEGEKRRLRNVFSRYVSPEVVRRIVERGETVLRGEQRELTIMFTDLRGFTSLSEGLTPEQVVTLLNRYFTPMTGLIRASEGTLDKFIGDAIMAFWNAPLDVTNHAERAVATGLTMLQTLRKLNEELWDELLVSLRMGVGIHTGMASVGNMGSEELTSYTAIGDTVNLASRLEGLCSRFGLSLIISEETASQCNQAGSLIVTVPLARLRVKGRVAPVEVYTALKSEDAERRASEISAFLNARATYQKAIQERNPVLLEEAAELFNVLFEQSPRIYLYREYAGVCRKTLTEPPDSWTDLWVFTTK